MLVQNGNLDCVLRSGLCSNDSLMHAAIGFHCKVYVLGLTVQYKIFYNSTADAIC